MEVGRNRQIDRDREKDTEIQTETETEQGYTTYCPCALECVYVQEGRDGGRELPVRQLLFPFSSKVHALQKNCRTTPMLWKFRMRTATRVSQFLLRRSRRTRANRFGTPPSICQPQVRGTLLHYRGAQSNTNESTASANLLRKLANLFRCSTPCCCC